MSLLFCLNLLLTFTVMLRKIRLSIHIVPKF